MQHEIVGSGCVLKGHGFLFRALRLSFMRMLFLKIKQYAKRDCGYGIVHLMTSATATRTATRLLLVATLASSSRE